MHSVRLIAATLALCMSAQGFAQDWFHYINREDRFALNLPSDPVVEEFGYTTEYYSELPARRYTVESGESLYRVTVVDMSGTDLSSDNEKVRNLGRHIDEIGGAVAFAATQIRRTGDVTLDAYNTIQYIPGHRLHVTLPDGRKNYAVMHLHQERLYVLECIVPGNMAPPNYVLETLEILDEDGYVPRYEFNSFPGYVPLNQQPLRHVTDPQ